MYLMKKCVRSFLIFVVFNIFHLVYAQLKLPDNMPLCKRSDPNLNDCLKDAIQKSYAVLINGLPQFELPPLDPMHLHEIRLDPQEDGSLHVKLKMTHSDLQGLSKLQITSVDADWDNYRIKINVNIDAIILVGDYEVEGKMMVLPISGSGRYNFTFEGGSGHMELFGKGVTKNGMTYMDIENLSWAYDMDNMIIMMENLFNGDRGRSDNMNAFLNEHWREINDELKERTQKSFADSFKEFAKHIFDNVPIDYIALP